MEEQLEQTEVPTGGRREASIAEQARVASELYSMLLRGVSLDDQRLLHLSAAYPESAALAHQFAERGRHALLAEYAPATPEEPVSEPREEGSARPPAPRGRSVIRRVGVLSCVRFCACVGFVVAVIKLMSIGALAVVATVSRERHPEVTQYIDQMVEYAQLEHIYKVLTEMSAFHISSASTEMTPAAVLDSMSSDIALLVSFPILTAVTCALLGLLVAHVVNISLRGAGGVRVEHDD